MSKIVLDEVTSKITPQVLNTNFDRIEDALNNQVLYRDLLGATEPNQIEQDIDANGNTFYNLRDAVDPHEPITKGQLSTEIGEIINEGGVVDHGALTGLSDDDHPQYHNDVRGDARYSQLGHTHSYEPANANIQAHIASTSNPHNTTAAQVGAQETLVSGTNIKTINGNSLLGSGDLVISNGGGTWGSITGTLSDQTDLQAELDGKEDVGVAASLDAAHVAASDPHPQYAPENNPTFSNQINFTPITAPAMVEGRLYYDTDKKALTYFTDVSNTSMQIGFENWVRVRNNTGYTILNGQVVKVSGATGQNPTIALARADTAEAYDVLGVATADIANNAIGYVTTFGEVRDLNTSSYAEGAILYLSGTVSGGFTTTKPTHPIAEVAVAVVLYSHVNQGKIFVSVNDAGAYSHLTHELTEHPDYYTNGIVHFGTTPPSPAKPLWWNTETGELNVYYNDGDSSQYVVANPSSSDGAIGREVLIANRTYYVATTGSDSNNGLSSGTAFLTLQKAVDVAASLDQSTYSITISVADGTYGAVVLKTPVGSGDCYLTGNVTTPANCIISSSSACITSTQKNWLVRGFKLTSSGSDGIQAAAGTYITYDKLDFGSCTGRHVVSYGGVISVSQSGTYTISGGAYAHVEASGPGSSILHNSVTVTVTGTPAFSAHFAGALNLGGIVTYLVTYSGSATGKRYSATLNGVINTYGGGASYFPGSVVGTTATGGQYA